MTTIVCDKTQMVADSRASDGMVSCNIPKVFRIRGGLLGVAGDMGQAMAFVAWFRAGCKPPPPALDDLEALYLSPSGKITCYDGSPHSYEIRDKFAGIGSGAGPALGAMHAGADAKTAVKIAAKVNPGTGGRIRVRKL